MTRDEMAKVMEAVFRECQTLRQAGQQEYAHEKENAFRNFEQVGTYLNIPREKILLVYAIKHLDGIVAWVNGQVSQREPVEDRVNDLIVYMCLLRGMIEEQKITNQQEDEES